MRITQTTDNKYIGMMVDAMAKEIIFPDGFIMQVQYIKFAGDKIKVGNDNYIIILKEEK